MNAPAKGVLAVMDDIASRLKAVADECSPTYKRYMSEPAQALTDARNTVAALIETLEALAKCADSDPFCSMGHVFEHGAGSAVRDLVALAKGGAA